MPGSNPPRGRDENNRKTREALKSLEKKKAPWYFEAQLHQRLARGWTRGRAGLEFTKPLPAYAYSLLILVAVGIIGYYALILPGEVPDTTEGEVIDSTVARDNLPVPVPVPKVQSTPTGGSSQELIEERGHAQRNPSAPSDEGARESAVLDRSPAFDKAKPATISQPQLKIQLPIQDEVKRPLLEEELVLPTRPGDLQPAVSPIYVVDDSMRMKESAIDSLDSLGQKPDSLDKPQE
ncbi:MAG: hypothetical protein O7D34_07350 [Ignavibacteria bacterium]|nr:hypothetical protein [Ignavibacteria bacterium]